MEYNIGGRVRVVAGVMTCLAFGMSTLAPQAVAQGSYPDTSGYRQIASSDLPLFTQVNNDGVWFTSPVGLDCGIGGDGSFGCSGSLPGVPRAENEISWFPGDPIPRLYQTSEPRFSTGRYQEVLAPRRALRYRGTTCAVTKESETYCVRDGDPNSQFLIGHSATYRGGQA